MKIYCETVQPELDQYIGKDAWIMCHGYGDGVRWTRILKAEYWDNKFAYYYVNEVSGTKLWWFLNPSKYSERRLDANHIPVITERRGELEVIEPLVVKTTQELFEMPDYEVDNDIVNIFDQFVGSNIWVRAEQQSELWSDYYIRISAKNGNVITYDCIEAQLIDNPISVDLEGPPPSESDFYKNDKVSHIDDWKITNPDDILTTEEIDAAFEEAEDYWNENSDWANNRGDFYYEDEDE